MHMVANKSGLAAVLAMVLALAGCVEPEPAQPVKAMSPALKQEMIDVGIAGETVKQCGGDLTFNHQQLARLKPLLDAVFLDDNGKPPSNRMIDAIIKKNLDMRTFQDQFLGYVQRRNILITDSRSWCAAGKQEIARKTGIGKYLLPRIRLGRDL